MKSVLSYMRPLIRWAPLLSLVGLSACSSLYFAYINGLARSGSFQWYGNIAYGRETLQHLDVYTPENSDPSAALPVVIFIYGGCWGACQNSRKKDYAFVAQALTSKNMICVVVDFRVYPQVLFATIMDDVSRAVEWVGKHIQRYGGNSKRLYLMGHSSGAHIASMLSFNHRYLKPVTYASVKGFIGLAGPYDFLPFKQKFLHKLFAPETSYKESQPIHVVNSNQPPSLLLYGEKDNRVAGHHIIRLRQKIQSVGAHVETHVYPNLGHAGILSALTVPMQKRRPVLTDIVRFVNNNP